MMCATTCTGSESRIPDRKYTTHNSPERIVFSDIEGGGTEAHPPLDPSDQGPPLDAIIKGLGIAKIQVRSAIQFEPLTLEISNQKFGNLDRILKNSSLSSPKTRA